jgi:TolB-like protein
MKKKIKIMILLCLVYGTSYCQDNNSFDNSLKQLTDQLAAKLATHSNEKIAVWDLSDMDGGVTKIGKYIAEDLTINLADKFHLVNRNQLNTIIKENKLKSEGFIDQVTTKQLKKLSNIDIIITGTITVLSNNIKITLQALDEDANIIAGTKGDVLMNDDIRELLGIPGGGTSNSSANKGFNRPLNSNESYNNPETVNQKCKEKNTGDYCFMNNTDRGLRVIYQENGLNMGEITLSPGQTQCFYDVSAGSKKYFINETSNQAPPNHVWINAQGQINVEQCKSKTFVIK